MAELVVKSQCRSVLRQGLDTVLNVSFPLWGIASPIVMVCLLFAMVSLNQSNRHSALGEFLAYFAICLCYSFSSLLLKRTLAHDFISVDKQGISLPFFMGSTLSMRTQIPWSKVSCVTASVVTDDIRRSRISILQTNGKETHLPVYQLQHDFIEQFLLATKMWAPTASDKSLEDLEGVLRIGARATEQASYTELWEEELSRRFCPTSYVPLETGRVLRNSSLKIVNHLCSGDRKSVV